MKRALNTQTVWAKEKSQLGHGGPSLRQTSGTDPPIKDLSKCHQWVWGLTHRRAIKAEIIAIHRDWIYNQACTRSHDIHAISYSFIMLDDHLILTMKRKLSSDSLEFIDQIAIKYWPWNALLQKSFQANLVFKYQLWMSLVDVRECFTKFMILIALFQHLSSKNRFLLLKSLTFEHIRLCPI